MFSHERFSTKISFPIPYLRMTLSSENTAQAQLKSGHVGFSAHTGKTKIVSCIVY